MFPLRLRLLVGTSVSSCRFYARKIGKPPTRNRLSMNPALKSKNPNAGVQGQLLIQKEMKEKEFVENFDEFEGDLFQAHKSHRQFEEESIRHKEKIKEKIIERKYFKPSERHNFLTWAEKEQIRHLFATARDEWPIERLAESFPATTEVILKLVKNKWQPDSSQRIEKHDEKVKKTWQAFKEHKLVGLDADLVEHLNKFSGRSYDVQSTAYSAKPDQTEFQFPQPKTKEFSHILLSCKKLTDKSKEDETEMIKSKESEMALTEGHFDPTNIPAKPNDENDSILLEKIKYRKYQTIEEFDKMKNKNAKVTKSAADERPFNSAPLMNEMEIKVAARNPNGTGIVDMNNREFLKTLYNVKKYETKQSVVKYKESNAINVDVVKEKIYIPRKLYKKGKLFRLRDCFYDDQGDFLYRVPGLTGSPNV